MIPQGADSSFANAGTVSLRAQMGHREGPGWPFFLSRVVKAPERNKCTFFSLRCSKSSREKMYIFSLSDLIKASERKMYIFSFSDVVEAPEKEKMYSFFFLELLPYEKEKMYIFFLRENEIIHFFSLELFLHHSKFMDPPGTPEGPE